MLRSHLELIIYMNRVSIIIFRLFYTPITLELISRLVHVPIFFLLNPLVGTNLGLFSCQNWQLKPLICINIAFFYLFWSILSVKFECDIDVHHTSKLIGPTWIWKNLLEIITKPMISKVVRMMTYDEGFPHGPLIFWSYDLDFLLHKLLPTSCLRIWFLK